MSKEEESGQGGFVLSRKRGDRECQAGVASKDQI